MQCILALAEQVEPQNRQVFLDNFRSTIPGEEPREVAVPTTGESFLLGEIEELREEVEARIESIQDGTFWDDYDDDDWHDPYSDEDPDLLNDEQSAALAGFFHEAGLRFIHGGRAAAEEIYSVLFALIDEVDADGSLPDINVDLREARARYARCIYETSNPDIRIPAMLQVMYTDLQRYRLAGYHLHNLPLLQDVIDASPGDLAEFDSFLTSWQTALSREDFGNARIADLLLEATFFQGGVGAVGELARTWREKQPRGYLYWLHQLEREERWAELRDGAGEAIAALPNEKDLYKAADFLITAGRKLGEDRTILAGNRQRFHAIPNDGSLLALVVEAGRQQVRAAELAEVCDFFSKRARKYGEVSLRVKALLMTGRMNEAFILCKQDKEVGWSLSDTPASLVFAGALYLLCGGDAACSLIHELLKKSAISRDIWCNRNDFPEIDLESAALQEILHGLVLCAVTDLDRDSYRQWTGTLGEKRVNSILTGKHRSAYDRAAMVLGSLAEAMAAASGKKKAQDLLHEYCRVLYNRHTAFRREVREAVGRSQILRGMAGGL